MSEDEIIALLRDNLADFSGDKQSLLEMLYDVVDNLEREVRGIANDEEDDDDEFDEDDSDFA